MSYYTAFWKGLKEESIEAKSSYDAQQKAVAIFKSSAGRKKVNGYDISIVLEDTTIVPDF